MPKIVLPLQLKAGDTYQIYFLFESYGNDVAFGQTTIINVKALPGKPLPIVAPKEGIKFLIPYDYDGS